MKIYFLLSIFILSNSDILSQEILVDYQHEIFCGSENYNNQITYNLEPIGVIWDVYWPTPTTCIFTIDTDGSSDGGSFVAEPNESISYWKGYNYIASPKRVPAEDFGFGLYRLSVMNKYIYLDWRDTRYGSYNYCTGHCADIWIKYDGNDGNIYLKNKADFVWGIPVLNGRYFSIWELKNQGTQSTENVPYFWQNCLVLIPSQTGNHPRLIWGPHPTFNATNYRIYRAVSNYPVKPVSLYYNLIQTVDSLTFEFTDYDVAILPGYQYAYYYVVGWNGTNESENTNYVSTPAEFHKEAVTEVYYEYGLTENYPNPFNPTTTIIYQLPVSGLVSLKVYDILGSEVATLVKEEKPAGSYQINFNAEKLSSGVYFYRLQAGSFTQTKKMMVLK